MTFPKPQNRDEFSLGLGRDEELRSKCHSRPGSTGKCGQAQKSYFGVENGEDENYLTSKRMTVTSLEVGERGSRA